LPLRFQACLTKRRQIKRRANEVQDTASSFVLTLSEVSDSTRKGHKTLGVSASVHEELGIEPSMDNSHRYQEQREISDITDADHVPDAPSTPTPSMRAIMNVTNLTIPMSPYGPATPTALSTSDFEKASSCLSTPCPSPRPVRQASDAIESTTEIIWQPNFCLGNTGPAIKPMAPEFGPITSWVDSVGERYVQLLGLEENGKLPDKHSAHLLQMHLFPLQRQYDIKRSKQLVCALVGNPEERETRPDWSKNLEEAIWRHVTYRPRAEIVESDKLKRSGNTTINENALNVEYTEMEIIRKWAEFKGFGNIDPSEGAVEKAVGSMLHGIFYSESGEIEQVECVM
jgi:hypothetical protein